MKKNVTDILDIHTHKLEADSLGKSIVNYPLLADSPSYMPFAGDVEVDRGYYYSVGIHPWELTPDNLKQQSDFIIEHLPDKRIVAIGEGGLDKLKGASMEIQTAAFMAQMTLSMEYDLPLILHNVRMTDKILAVKKQFRPGQPWIWHGFRGKPEQAEQLQGKGFYLSFGEFYSDEAMRAVSDDRLFLETDESSLDIEELLYRAARVRGVGVETLRETIRRNIQNVFFRA